jgi:hypothetical protein
VVEIPPLDWRILKRSRLVVRNNLVKTWLAARTRSQSLPSVRSCNAQGLGWRGGYAQSTDVGVAKLAAAGCSHTRRSQLTTGQPDRGAAAIIAPTWEFWSPTCRRNGWRWLQIRSAVYFKSS